MRIPATGRTLKIVWATLLLFAPQFTVRMVAEDSPPAGGHSSFLSSLALLVIGFLLTTVTGAIIASMINKKSWERQTRIDLFKQRYVEGTTFLDELSKSVGSRFFALQRFLWAIDTASDEKLQAIEQHYFKTVSEWNAKYWMNRNKIRLLIGDERANLFLDYRDDFHPDAPQSLHYHFVKAHRFVMSARNKQIATAEAQKAVDDLNWASSELLEILTTEFLKRATALELLKAPAVAESTLTKAMLEHSRQPRPPRDWSQPH
ncbi:MAG TPA: hypothetical protein VGN01_05250 [Acidobacteriaceae bacterium]|jgi:hypothetical protein